MNQIKLDKDKFKKLIASFEQVEILLNNNINHEIFEISQSNSKEIINEIVDDLANCSNKTLEILNLTKKYFNNIIEVFETEDNETANEINLNSKYN